jgi:hypothetical protein
VTTPVPANADGSADQRIAGCDAEPFRLALQLCTGHGAEQYHQSTYRQVQDTMLYCNAVGSQTEIVFDGGSLVYDAWCNKVKEMKYFEEDYALFDLAELSAAKPSADKPTGVKELVVEERKGEALSLEEPITSTDKTCLLLLRSRCRQRLRHRCLPDR